MHVKILPFVYIIYTVYTSGQKLYSFISKINISVADPDPDSVKIRIRIPCAQIDPCKSIFIVI